MTNKIQNKKLKIAEYLYKQTQLKSIKRLRQKAYSHKSKQLQSYAAYMV